MRTLRRLLMTGLLLGIAQAAFAEVFCVTTAVDLQSALTTATTNAQDDEVRIVQGTYVGNFVYASTQANKLSVLGGYTTGCADRTIDPVNTILDGNQTNRVLALSAPDVAAELLVEGLTLRKGKHAGGDTYSSLGGGLYAQVGDLGAVTVNRNRIEDNTGAIGGAYISATTVTLTNNIIADNPGGGAGSYWATTVTLTNNSITGNTAYNSGGSGIYQGGASIGATTVTTLSNNTFADNTGGGAFIFNTGTATLSNNNISGNTDIYGGGGALIDRVTAATLSNNNISGNTALYGGGVYISMTETATLTNNDMSGNTSSYSGGGVYLSATTATFTNNDISGNTSSYGGGLYLEFQGSESQRSLALINNLFWLNHATGNLGADFHINNTTASQVTLLANNFDWTPSTGFWVGTPVYIDASNLNKLDPLFVDASTGDHHLQPGSPMIDAGYLGAPDLPDFDIEGTLRVLGNSVDIGAYEFDDGSDPKAILTLTLAGTGSGSVTSSPTGINCGSDCFQAYDITTLVTLTATPIDTDSVFDGWSGDADCEDGQITMDANLSCTATFSAVRQLTVTRAGDGSGLVTSTPSGIACGAACAAYFYLDESVTLTAVPDAISIFVGWSDDASCPNPFLDSNRACTATFDPLLYRLFVFVLGTGSGTVTSVPSGINCGADCEKDYRAGTVVTLTAVPNSDSDFWGWSGACTGMEACQVTLEEGKSVTATFTQNSPSAAPTNLTASAVSATRILLIWEDRSDNESEFRIERKNGVGGTWSQIAMAPANTIIYADNIPAGTTDLFYRVRAANDAGSSGYSNEAMVTTPGQRRLAAGYEHSLLIGSDGRLWAWGYNGYGELGEGTTTTRYTPTPILTGVANLAAMSNNTLALKTDGSLWAWGRNDSGQLGDGTSGTGTHSSTPTQVLTEVVNLAAGGSHTLALKSDGSLWAWGANESGQLGDGTTTNRYAPQQVLTGVVNLAAGGHSLALKADGSLWAWGNNSYGQLGDGTTTNRSTPTQVLTGVVNLAAGGHSLALKADGSLWAWGNNSWGQLGDGTTSHRFTPTQVLTGVVAISAGTYHTLALRSDGSLWAWGLNNSGQLGDGTYTNRATPIQVLTGVTAMAVGNWHTLALKTDGSLWAWGANNFGQLGDGTTTNLTSPRQVTSFATDPPDAPTNFSVQAVSTTGITLTWTNASDNELGFEVERRNDTGAWALLATLGGNTTGYADVSLNEGVTYGYRVRAYNTAGVSAYTPEVTTTMLPQAPSGLGASAVSENRIDLTWTDNSAGETAYVIERKNGTSGTWDEIATLDANVTHYADTGLTSPVTYIYRVRAANPAGYSGYSNEAAATTLILVTATAGANGSISPPSRSVAHGATTTFTVTPDTGYSTSVTGCGGSLSDTTYTTGAITAACAVTASFTALPKYTLTVTKSGTGTVASAPAGINCGYTCRANFTSGTFVTLTATAGAGYQFASWTGCTSVSGNTCTVAMTGAKSIKASFTALPKYTLTVTKSGTGTVASAPAGINCGYTCRANFTSGSSVKLTATAGAGYQFASWTGCTSVSGNTCTVAMTGAKSIKASFTALPKYTLTVTKSGTGTVASAPAGISCGSDCSEAYSSGTPVTLTATAGTGYQFASWTGCDSVSGTACTVVMAGAMSVKAEFIPAFKLSLSKSGYRYGSVTSAPTGISCGTSCSATSALFASGTTVTLTATPITGRRFKNWSGACTGLATSCVVPMTKGQSVTAVFQ